MKQKLLLLILITNVWLASSSQVINVSDFGVTENGDATSGLIRAIKKCKEIHAKKLMFPKGTYHFYPDFGTEQFFFISNNDDGLKRIVFLLSKMQNLTIDGQGSHFIFHGFVNPFILSGSSNIRLENFSIDYHRPFHSEAIVLAVYKDSIDLEIKPAFPFRIVNNLLQFTDFPDPNADEIEKRSLGIYEYRILLEFDTKKRETAYMVSDQGAYLTPVIAKSIGERSVRIYRTGIKATIGNTIVFGYANRNYPGIVISDCSNTILNNVVINHCGGMAIIGQRSHNITVDHCKVTPSQGRMVSATGDATHFVNCSGQITLSNSLFENQMDDATNIHGIYVKTHGKVASNEIIVRLVHMQQQGFDFIRPGMDVELVHSRSMIAYDTLRVQKVDRINKQFTRIVFANNLPADFQSGDALAEINNYPKVYIHDNIIRANRARGILLNSRGATVVENNYFHNAGAAILFEGDARFWFEQGGVRDCIIKNNEFDNCMFGIWGKAVIDVGAGITEDFEQSRYNRNIVISNNTFKVFDDTSLLNLYCVDGLTWKNNTIIKTNSYPPARSGQQRFVVKYSNNIQIDHELIKQ